MGKNLWILTEEKPKKEVIDFIVARLAKDNKWAFFKDSIRFIPIVDNKKFSFTYEVTGYKCNNINKIFIKTLGGFSSFVDYLAFFQDNQPTEKDVPVYAIEETKTDDKESRNTGVYQRASKFVYINQYYPNVPKIMFYNLRVTQKEKPTATYIFGTKLLLTLGVEIVGKTLDQKLFKPFTSVEEIILYKEGMRKAPAGNVQISIKKIDDTIFVTGRLYKSGGLAHDPNIGALSLICATIRKLGWKGGLVICNHGLLQKHLGNGNKFVKIAHLLNLEIQGLTLPTVTPHEYYWRYETQGEKLATIFIHIVVENFTRGFSIFENHAGCEKSYFVTSDQKYIPLEKYSDRRAYKRGNKKKIISIPDLILLDVDNTEVISVEGKKYQYRGDAIKELNAYRDIEKLYIKKHYPKFKCVRTVVLYGGQGKKIIAVKIGFVLNENGGLVLGIQAPRLFRQAIKNLQDFWS